MKGKEAYNQLIKAYEEAENRPMPSYIRDKDDFIVFSMHVDGKLGQIRSIEVNGKDKELILCASPYDWTSFKCCTNKEIIRAIEVYSEFEVCVKSEGAYYPVKNIKNDFMGENEDDEGFNFVDFEAGDFEE